MPPAVIPAIGVAANIAIGQVITATVLKIALSVAVSVALSALSSALAPKPKTPQLNIRRRDNAITVRQPVAPRQVVFGEGGRGVDTVIDAGLCPVDRQQPVPAPRRRADGARGRGHHDRHLRQRRGPAGRQRRRDGQICWPRQGQVQDRHRRPDGILRPDHRVRRRVDGEPSAARVRGGLCPAEVQRRQVPVRHSADPVRGQGLQGLRPTCLRP